MQTELNRTQPSLDQVSRSTRNDILFAFCVVSFVVYLAHSEAVSTFVRELTRLVPKL